MNGVRAAASLLLAILLTACASDLDRRYLDATLNQKLDLPPDMIESGDESTVELPGAISGDDQTAPGKVPVLAKVESLKLERNGDMYWLSVEKPVDELYRIVKNFWGEQGYRLVVDEPVIGLMQTEWVYSEAGQEESQNWIQKLFGSSDLTATQDQFRTRIERGPDGKNRVYIAHRGTEYIHVFDPRDTGRNVGTSKDKSDQWHYRQPDPELEIEMLSRLMVYLGVQESEVDKQVANLKLYSPQAFLHLDSENNSPYLILKSPYQIAWNRVLHELDRLNFEIEKQNFKSGLSGDGLIFVKTLVKQEADDGGFFSFKPTSETRERKMVLVFSEDTHALTRVDIENSAGDPETSPEAVEFLTLLYRHLR